MRYTAGSFGWLTFPVWYVPMTDDEWTDAHHFGTRRHDDAREHGMDYSRRQPVRTRRDQYNHEQQNFLGRMAFCAAMGIEFDDQIGVTAGDPEFGIQRQYVVHTVDGDDRQLIIRPAEPEDRIYVLGQVLTDAVHVVLVGWTKGREECNEFTWTPSPPPPCWQIPRERLHPMSDLL
jgi:hypothetical protein